MYHLLLLLVASDVIASFTISRVLFVVARLRTRRSALDARDALGVLLGVVTRLPLALSSSGSRHSPERPI